jgi:hypothetical protein
MISSLVSETEELRKRNDALNHKIYTVYQDNLNKQKEIQKSRLQIKTLVEENEFLKENQKMVDKLKHVIQNKNEIDSKTSYERMRKIIIMEYKSKGDRDQMFLDLKEIRNQTNQRSNSTLNLNEKEKYINNKKRISRMSMNL